MSNAKSVKPESVEITIGKENYIIRFTLNSFIKLEEMYGDVETAMKKLEGEVVTNEAGIPIMEEITDENGEVKTVEKRKVSFKTVRDILYAGLISVQPQITEGDVGNFEFSDFSQIMTKLMKALTGSLPADKTEGEKVKN